MEENYTIVEKYTLPSKGLIYEKKVNPDVELTSMTAKDEMRRLSPSTTPFKTLCDIIEGRMIEKPAVHVYDMILGDYEYLLHKLRVVTYGDSYKLITTCPHCYEQTESVTHLNDLVVREFDKEKFEAAKTFMLPKSGKMVTLKYQTPRMLDEMENKIREMKRKNQTQDIDLKLFVLLTSIIESVDGEILNEFEVSNFINKLPAMDMNKILSNIDVMNNCLGLDNLLRLTCDKCGGEVETFFRFGTEFFRPTTE